MNQIFLRCKLVVCLLGLLPMSNPGQDVILKRESLSIGTAIGFHSGILIEDRTLNVYLPLGYADSTKSYPVIYLLDGSMNEDFLHVTGIVQFLTMIGAMPETIVVGIGNVDRKRDFTFPTRNEQDKKDYPTTGGSANFIEFVRREVIPLVKNEFRINGHSTLIGQSLGGLLAAEILFRHPDMFNDYIVVSPSLWWDDESILAEWRNSQLPQSHTGKIYLSVGTEGDQMEGDAKTFYELLKRSAPPSCTVEFAFMPGEDHLTILHNCVYQAFLFLYHDKD